MDANRMLVHKSLLFLLFAASAGFSVTLHASRPAAQEPPSFNSTALPSFTAAQVRLPPESDRIVDRARLDLSSKGMKITRGEGRYRQVFMQDFTSGQTWLIAPGRAIQHEVQYESVPVEEAVESQAAPVSTDSPAALPQSPRSGLLSPAPCISYPRLKRLKVERWRGQPVSAWGCLDESGTHVASDYFSADWKLVIRSELVGLHVEELRGITALSFPPEHFQVDERYAPASLGELINGTDLRLRKYE